MPSATRLQQVSSDVLKVSDGSLYPALHKLEQEGWLTATWQTTENNRRAKVYALSRSGRRRLEKETDNWTRAVGRASRSVVQPDASVNRRQERWHAISNAGSTCLPLRWRSLTPPPDAGRAGSRRRD